MPATLQSALNELRSLRRFLDRSDERVLLALIGLKLLLLVFGWAAMQVLANRAFAPNETVFSIWNRWDAPHYLFLAQYGYQPSGEQKWFLVFFPLFPWLVRLLAPLFDSYFAAALGVSTLASFALAVLFRRLAALDGEDLADSAVFFLFAFPTAYVLHIGYTESLFMALSVGAFLAARRGRWPTAGVLGALAALARINAIMLVPALAVEAWLARGRGRRRHAAWLWVAFPLLGILVYLTLNNIVGGHPLRFLDYQTQHWYRSFAWPWHGMTESWRAFEHRTAAEAQLVGFQELLFTLIGLAATLVAWFRLRLSYAVWMTGNWLLFTCQSFIMSVPRYTLILFPLFILFAQLAKKRTVAALLVFWSLLFFALFAGQFVQGRWAF